jgi:hypothetical protein
MRGRSQGGCEVLSPIRCAMRPHAQTHSACVNARQPQTCDLGSWRRGGPPIEHHRRSRILATSRDHRSNHCSTACSMCVVAARPVRPVRLVKSQLCDVYSVRALQVCGAQFVQVGLFGNPPKRRPDGKYFDDWLVTSTEIRTLNPCTSSEFYFHRAENVPFVERHNVPLQIRGAWDFVPCFHHFFQSRDCAD